MTLTIPYYHKSVDWDQFMADYPPPPFYHQTVGRLSADALNALQEKRFLDRVAEAWEVSFYQRHWGAAGLEKGDITRLEHIDRIPTFTSDDLKGAAICSALRRSLSLRPSAIRAGATENSDERWHHRFASTNPV